MACVSITSVLRGFLKTDGVSPAITVSDIDTAALERASALGVATTTENLAVAAAHPVILLGTEPVGTTTIVVFGILGKMAIPFSFSSSSFHK